MHVDMALSFVVFLDVVLDVMLHLRPIIAYSQGFLCWGVTAEVQAVDPFVEFLQDFEGL